MPRGGGEVSDQEAGSCEKGGCGMLAYDIETTGLSRTRDIITVVCVYGHGCGEHGRVFNFLYPDKFEENREELLALLDAAPQLASFNGVRFDAPFIQSYLCVDPARVGAWIQKTFDVWEISKTMLRMTFKMDKLLHVNGFESKSGSGLQAIEWAKDERMWPVLEQYCLDDARLTYEVSMLRNIVLPLGANEVEMPDEARRQASSFRIIKEVDAAGGMSFHIKIS